MSIEKTRNQ